MEYLCYFSVPGTKVSDITSKLLRNGKPVMAKDIEVVVKSDKVVITFKKPPREASGDYELCLGNATGEDKMKLNFNFIGKVFFLFFLSVIYVF